ncbi:hypothetical protein POM88_026327 [Heracleum sosnowskyi]|uniref:Uncharacterized protein n=1 Tax=Heracleum sosnowskyi TaxID=360622 RepID=A0AAD8I697_9APIA|nr:hypothetical protein POM88_026327 [Heracleum sosnowskyi]
MEKNNSETGCQEAGLMGVGSSQNGVGINHPGAAAAGYVSGGGAAIGAGNSGAVAGDSGAAAGVVASGVGVAGAVGNRHGTLVCKSIHGKSKISSLFEKGNLSNNTCVHFINKNYQHLDESQRNEVARILGRLNPQSAHFTYQNYKPTQVKIKMEKNMSETGCPFGVGGCPGGAVGGGVAGGSLFVSAIDSHILEYELVYLTKSCIDTCIELTEPLTQYRGDGAVGGVVSRGVDGAFGNHPPTHPKIESLKMVRPSTSPFFVSKKCHSSEEIEALGVQMDVIQAQHEHFIESASKNICLQCSIAEWRMLDNLHLEEEMDQLKSEGARFLAGHNQQNRP